MEKLNILFDIHLFVILANIGVAFVLWYGTRSRLARNLGLGWLFYLLAGLGNVLVVNQPYPIRYLVAMPPSLGMALVYCALVAELFDCKIRWRAIFTVLAVAFVVAIPLMLLGAPAPLYGSIMCLAVTMPMFISVFDAFFTRGKGSFMRTGTAIVVFLLAAHMTDYPFLSQKPEFVVVGLYAALLIVFGISIFGPAAITERVSAENSRITTELQYSKQMVEVARKAGMAEIAIGILHNVGNTLNSVNVSASLVVNTSRQSKLPSLARLIEELEKHKSDLGSFVANDPTGQAVLPYLSKLSETLSEENGIIKAESDRLVQGLETVKQVIALQQSYATLGQSVERLKISDVVENAIQVSIEAGDRSRLRIVREFQELQAVEVDKQRLLQILVNLLSNAKYAVSEVDQGRITVRLMPQGNSKVVVEVEDNGIGIAPEQAKDIFRFGYTTRKEGHGFGLHNSANAAKELGGSLVFRSEGKGKGAVFTLTIPNSPERDINGRA